jgi:hypothetical protein
MIFLPFAAAAAVCVTSKQGIPIWNIPLIECTQILFFLTYPIVS